MATKQAGELVAGDVWQEPAGRRRRLRVVEVRPGSAAPIVRVVVKDLDTGTIATVDFGRADVIELGDVRSLKYATALDQAEAQADRCGRAYIYRHRSEAAGYFVSAVRLDAPLCVTVERDSAGIVFTGAPATDWEEV